MKIKSIKTMNKKQEDFYIEVLKWAKEKGTFTAVEIRNRFDLDKDSVKNDLITELWQKNLFCDLCVDKEMKLHISYQAYFDLLKYQELEEARQASINANKNAKDANERAKDANKSAKMAICVSIIAMILTAVFSILQIWCPTKLNQDQIDVLTHPNISINQKQIEEITNSKFKLDDEQLETLTLKPIRIDQEQIEVITNRPIRFDTEQMETIRGWIDQRKPEPQKKANQ